ncbi:hypothetical protein B0E45_08550 [Sinorhizobium sp. A49]|uniref:DUF2332 domain-containing protein n=1 Tax=Sinorhizobium sp. A49 TaxID=1945861 RepID=UPI000986D4F1|nr:DUF2332 family protein [Sinorhizobium sp. A49]OOG72491.1 hypothetical protein B0E45_08550 [Sinorhizobium sp. A49]
MSEAKATEQAVRDAFRDQAKSCDGLGSPFTARLCRLIADRLKADTPVGVRVLGWQGDPTSAGDSVALRLCGALHALVRTGRDGRLQASYPPIQLDDETLWPVVDHAIRHEAEFILDWLQSAPQTNEVRRSSALLAGFLTLADLFGKPLMLSEVGASAGLNLHWDRYRYRLGDTAWGDPASRVVIEPRWTGPNPPTTEITVAGRAGCDLNPLDPASEQDRLRLLSYIWADQQDRLDRTGFAFETAAARPERVVRADAIDWLRPRLAQHFPGAVHVVYHTIAWQYFPKASQDEGEALIAEAGRNATPDAPFARLQMEADGQTPGAALSLQIWPSGGKHLIGRADFHGRWVEWTGWPTI